MKNNIWARIVGLGVLTWVIPFVVAIPLFGPNGPRIPQPLFKSIMAVVGVGVGVWLLAHLFRRGVAIANAGLVVGLVWLAINLALDFAILLPLSGQRVGDYMMDIGLRYLVIPIMSMAIAGVARR